MKRILILLVLVLSLAVSFGQKQEPAVIEYVSQDYKILSGQKDHERISGEYMVELDEEYLNERLGLLKVYIEEGNSVWTRLYYIDYETIKNSEVKTRYTLYNWDAAETGWVDVLYSRDTVTIEIFDRLGLVMNGTLRTDMKIVLKRKRF